MAVTDVAKLINPVQFMIQVYLRLMDDAAISAENHLNTEHQIRRGTDDNSKMIFLISQQKYIL